MTCLKINHITYIPENTIFKNVICKDIRDVLLQSMLNIAQSFVISVIILHIYVIYDNGLETFYFYFNTITVYHP